MMLQTQKLEHMRRDINEMARSQKRAADSMSSIADSLLKIVNFLSVDKDRP